MIDKNEKPTTEFHVKFCTTFGADFNSKNKFDRNFENPRTVSSILETPFGEGIIAAIEAWKAHITFLTRDLNHNDIWEETVFDMRHTPQRNFTSFHSRYNGRLKCLQRRGINANTRIIRE